MSNLIAVHGLGTRNSIGTAGYVQLLTDKAGPRKRPRPRILHISHIPGRLHIPGVITSYQNTINSVHITTSAYLAHHTGIYGSLVTFAHSITSVSGAITSFATDVITLRAGINTFAAELLHIPGVITSFSRFGSVIPVHTVKMPTKRDLRNLRIIKFLNRQR